MLYLLQTFELKIARTLIELGRKFGKVNFKKEKYFTPNLEADNLIWTNPLAYLFAVILDQGVKSGKSLGDSLFAKAKMGHLALGIKEIPPPRWKGLLQSRPVITI